MYALLWNHATQHFTSKDYRASVAFYAAAAEYADAGAKAAGARQLALAYLALQELDRSAQQSCDDQNIYCINGKAQERRS